ncbi:MAG: glutathione S-transferase family protein [SAR324 cluster bacterium]|nr:glutathione S-transferase family protein [SAR324 cluster bacterium]
MLNIWGRRNSSNVQKVMWTIGELGLEFKRHTVGDSFGGLKTEEYRKLNPNAVIPVIDDDGVIIWESNVIVRYLSAKYGEGNLWPKDPAKRAVADQWMDWMQTTVGTDSGIIFMGLVRTPADEQNHEAIAAAAKRLGYSYGILDRHLASSKYVGGDSFSMGDIPLGVNLFRYFNIAVERPELPHLQDWYQRLLERPAYREHVAFPFGSSLEEWLELEKAGR